jgi:hypothetical protein
LGKHTIGDIDFGKVATHRITAGFEGHRRTRQAKLPTRRRGGLGLR